MTARLLDGDALAAQWRQDIAARAQALALRGVTPGLATVLVGDDVASAAYVGRKHADCAETAIRSFDIRLPADVTEPALADVVRRLDLDRAVHGVVVQLPLPSALDGARILLGADPAKDVDGLHVTNLGRLMAGLPGVRPCTPSAVIGLLQDHGVRLAGARVAVIGRGALVGRPLAVMLGEPGVDATPTLLHTGSADLAAVTRECDVVISAAGQPNLVTAEMVRPGAAVVGVGISYQDDAMVSDIAPDVAQVAGLVTPPHGSVGPLTRAMLLRNLLDAVEATCRAAIRRP